MRAALLALALATPAAATPCGGDFGEFLQAIQAEATAAGIPADTAAAFFKGAQQDPKVLNADRAQGVFRKTFLDFREKAPLAATANMYLDKDGNVVVDNFLYDLIMVADPAFPVLRGDIHNQQYSMF